MEKILVKKLQEKARLPKRGSELAAGYDLSACIDRPVEIKPGEVKAIGTGLAMALPEHLCALILPRSGLAIKHGLRPANTPGLCDADYRGEYIVALRNDSSEPRIIHDGDRIAQVLFVPYAAVEFDERSSLSETHRGDGGFGSTGIK